MRSPLLLSIALSAACATGLQAQTAAAQKPADSATAAPTLAAAESKTEPKTPAKPARNKPADPPQPAAAEQAKPATPRPVPSPKATPAPAATPAPEAATPTPKKLNFFQRLFGLGKKNAATPAPATPAATPTPATPRPIKPRKPAETPAAGAKPEAGAEIKREGTGETAPKEKPAETEKPEKPAPVEKAPEKATEPAPSTSEPEAKTEKTEKREKTEKPAPSTPPAGKRGRGKAGATKPTAAAGESTKEQIELQKAIASGEPNEIERAKFNEAKARACEDPHVQELKQKADNASDAECVRALRAYNKALYQKIRNLSDSSISDYIDRREAAVLKKISESGGE